MRFFWIYFGFVKPSDLNFFSDSTTQASHWHCCCSSVTLESMRVVDGAEVASWMWSSPVIMPLMGTARCKQHVILFVTPGVSLFPYPSYLACNLHWKCRFEKAAASGSHRWRLGKNWLKKASDRMTEKRNGRCTGRIYVLMSPPWVCYFPVILYSADGDSQ